MCHLLSFLWMQNYDGSEAKSLLNNCLRITYGVSMKEVMVVRSDLLMSKQKRRADAHAEKARPEHLTGCRIRLSISRRLYH
jgi:hypothetical protein